MKILTILSYSLAIAAAVLYLPYPVIAPYLMAVGAIGLVILHFMERYEGKNLRLQRIIRMRHLVGVIYAAAAYFMFQRGQYWLISLLIASVLEIYTLWVIGREGKDQ